MLTIFVCVRRWGGGKDDKYFARLGKNVISVYETDTFSLLDKKSLKIENVVDFSWSPTDPIISLFVPEMGGGNQPARVSTNFCIEPLIRCLLSI
jgi:translation initiation factor 3 subunit B